MDRLISKLSTDVKKTNEMINIPEGNMQNRAESYVCGGECVEELLKRCFSKKEIKARININNKGKLTTTSKQT